VNYLWASNIHINQRQENLEYASDALLVSDYLNVAVPLSALPPRCKDFIELYDSRCDMSSLQMPYVTAYCNLPIALCYYHYYHLTITILIDNNISSSIIVNIVILIRAHVCLMFAKEKQ